MTLSAAHVRGFTAKQVNRRAARPGRLGRKRRKKMTRKVQIKQTKGESAQIVIIDIV